MRKDQLKTAAATLVATIGITSGALLAEAPKPESPSAAPVVKTKTADSAEMAQTEATLARFRELVWPQPGEYAANIAKIAWERDPWAAAVRAGKEGKPVIAYGVHSAGVTCGYG